MTTVLAAGLFGGLSVAVALALAAVLGAPAWVGLTIVGVIALALTTAMEA